MSTQVNIVDIKLLFRLQTLKIIFADGKEENLPFNYLQKKAGTSASIVNMDFDGKNAITLYFDDQNRYIYQSKA